MTKLQPPKPNLTARTILDTIAYASLATTDEFGQPWNTPVYCVYDEDYNIYWGSSVESQHSQNIRTNSSVFVVVYDSTVPWSTGVGVFIQAEAIEVTEKQEIAKACQLRKARVPEANQPPEVFMGNSPRRIYRATPQHIWINGIVEKDGQHVDVRIEASV